MIERQFLISRHEMNALLEWHIEQKFLCANKENFVEAHYHKERIEQIKMELDQS